VRQEPFGFHKIPDRVDQRRELEQALRLGVVAIWEPFDLRLQNGDSVFVPMEVFHEVGAGTPYTARFRIDHCEDIEQVLDVYILQRDPPCFFKVGIVWINLD